VQNDDGAFATRAMLRRDLARGVDRLAGTRAVVYQFAARELAFGDWQRLQLAPASGGF
jgi:alginate O-acetyltransferase complex protein AlgJ